MRLFGTKAVYGHWQVVLNSAPVEGKPERRRDNDVMEISLLNI